MSQVEKRKCGCGSMTDFRIVPAPRGEAVAVNMANPHKAPCGLPCSEGRDVTMSDVASGRAHHPSRCECLKQGRGYA